MLKWVPIALMLTFAKNVHAEALSEPKLVKTGITFEGKWCGMWDQIYDVCFDIKKDPNSSKGYKVSYSWVEYLTKPKRSKEIEVDSANANTLKMGNKIIVFSHQSRNHALAIGLFEQMSRMATLVRQ